MSKDQIIGSAYRRVMIVSTLTAALLLAASVVNAETSDGQGAPVPFSNWSNASGSHHGVITPAISKATAAALSAQQPAPPARVRITRISGQRLRVGTALGALGGFVAGGMIGARLDRNCRCDDPGLQGFVVGAPVGAVAGGILGYVLASR